MTQATNDALDAIRDLGRPDEMRDLAARGAAPPVRPKVNSHIHLPPNFSAFDSVQHAVDLADEQDVRVVGLTNYYDYRVYGEFAALGRERGIFTMFGVEIISLIDELVREGVLINDPGNPGKMYICGKGVTRFDPLTPRAEQILRTIREADTKRMAEMIARLDAHFAAGGVGVSLSEADVIDMIVKRHASDPATVTLQERHLAMAFQEALFDVVPPEQRLAKLRELFDGPCKADAPDDAVAIQGEIRSHLMKAGKPCFVTDSFVSFDEAYEMILQLGGVPCYPTLADGTDPICAYETPIASMIESIKGLGVHMAEYIPIRNQPGVLEDYVTSVRAAGIPVVGGTEHNTLKLLAIEPRCVGGAEVPERVRDIFWEGARICAAHQFLTLHGECGYVDEQGKPNPEYASAQERIEAMAGIGGAVIQRYFERYGR
jgi:hypothetical protein